MYPIREGRTVVSPWTALTLFAIGILPWNVARPQTVSPRTTSASAPTPRALVDQYCVVCHNQKSATAGVVLSGIDFDHTAGNAALLERVLRKFAVGRDASGRNAASRGAGGGGVHEIPGGLAGPGGCRQSQSWPARRASPESRGVQQCDPRRAGARYPAGVGAAGGRFGLRVRQHRRRAFDLAGPAGEVHVGRAPGEPAGGWRTRISSPR